MTRGQKKITYGLFYILVLAVIVWIIWPSAITVPSVCSEPSCGAVRPLETRSVGVFRSASAHRAVSLAEVSNLNGDLGLNFSYEFRILDKGRGTTAVISGNGLIYPSETRYLLGVYDAGQANLADVADGMEFRITSSSSVPAVSLLKPNLVFNLGPSIRMESDRMVVSATLKNLSSLSVENIRIVAILNNKYGDPVFAAQTLLRQAAGFSETPFEISMPPDEVIKNAVDPSETALFINLE